jgi:hypothetical protein
MKRQFVIVLLATAALNATLAVTNVRAADAWADMVVSYVPGSIPDAGYTDPASALGKPTLLSIDPFGFMNGVVTPLSPSFGYGETVSIGAGGSLTLRFADPVTNDPNNPFGVDLLVFGNAFIKGDFFGSAPNFPFKPEGLSDDVVGEGGAIEVSADGVAFFPVTGAADGRFPTNAYADIATAFTTTPGLVEANFTRPVDPAFNPIGKTFAQIVAGYGGSGGGLGVDIGPTGLSSISYVRITNPLGATTTPEIDALADVASIPEPAAGTMFFFGALILLGKFSRSVNVKTET